MTMKLRTNHHKRSSRAASRSFFAKVVIVMTIVTMGFVAPLQSVQKVAADQYDDQINSLQQQIGQYQVTSAQLNSQAATLQTALAQLANQQAALQAQIDLSQAQYDQLTLKIADTQQKIKDAQDALGQTIADLYINSQVTPLEMLASSKNVGDFVDKQTYRNSVSNQLTNTIAEIKTLKAQLDQQQSDLAKTLNEERSAKAELVAQQNEQQSLLAQTQGQEAAYQQLISRNLSQIAAAKAAQAAIRARASSTGGYTLVDAGSLPDYPWNSSNCPMQGYMSTGGSNNDPYIAPGQGGDGHGYGCRQCVSYVAYRVAKATSVYYNDLGNGGSAAYNLVHNHHWHDLGRTPQPGSVASLWGISSPPYSNNSYPGHTAYVEDVSTDGSKVLVTQYNYDYGTGYGMYSEMWLSANFFNQYAKP
jgi:peptidoglycan hydrolase CwlO-like protein